MEKSKVYGFWSAVFVLVSILLIDFNFVNSYLINCNFTEALFVFVIMSICSTRPIVHFAESLVIAASKLIP
ncbi:MAG: putative Na+/H+ antiporter [Bacteriovorax sp.]